MKINQCPSLIRREYEKRVAAIVEQSWMMSFPDEADSSSGKSKQNENASGGATTSAASHAETTPDNHNSASAD